MQAFSPRFLNNKGNIPRPSVVPKFSDLEVMALSLKAETMGIDSECYLFGSLQEYRSQTPNLISRRQFNERRKLTAGLCEKIRKRIAEAIDGGEDCFIIDTKPVKVCQLARGRRNKMRRTCTEKAPNFGYCAAQAMYYFGYKLNVLCGTTGVIHSYDLMQASIHDINYLNDVGHDFFKCTVISNMGYISARYS